MSFNKTVFIVFPLIIILFCLNSCINRDKLDNETEEADMELSFEFSSTYSTGAFSTDSVHITINDIGNSGLWILTFSASQEYPDMLDLNFYVSGIQLPGILDVDHSGLTGAVEFNAGAGNIYSAETTGSGGTVEVELFEEQVRVKGNFEFVLINTALDDTLYIANGLFDAFIDENLYITP